MGCSLVLAQDLPPRSRVLAEMLAETLDPRFATATYPCQIVLSFDRGGKLEWLQPSARVKARELGDVEHDREHPQPGS